MAAPSRHRARTSEPAAADLLTSLPPPLLDSILTRLDLRDAVRTSALSCAWRRRWEVLPYLPLSFLGNPGTPPVAVDRGPPLPRLDEAVIDVGTYVRSSNFRGFLARLAQVRKLALYTCYISFPAAGLLETLPCTFDNLRSLTLLTHFYEKPAMALTFCLLKNAPNLEELEIEIEGDDEDEIDGDFLNTQCTDAFCANLQVVKMKDIGWLPNEMYFIELVLSKAMVLRTMHISVGCNSSKSNEDALSELMTYRRASPHAQVFFDGKKP